MLVGVDPGGTCGCGIACYTIGHFAAITVKASTCAELYGLYAILSDALKEEGSLIISEAVIQWTRPGFRNDTAVIPLSHVEGVIMAAAGATRSQHARVNPSDLKKEFGISRKKASDKALLEHPGRSKSFLGEETRRNAKQQMIDAMRARGHNPTNEHEADALALVEYALSRTKAYATA